MIQWIPYSPDEVAARQLNGEPTAILYFANWTVGANHRGGLLSPSIAQSLAAFQLAVMSADLTDANSGDFQRLAETGIVEIPAFVLYPGGNDSEPVIFLSGTADEEIVAAIEHSAG
ncbi:thiol:disulfide interchange protein [Roseiconus lacunae]|uniref:thiol:disulfide interchange protein n=1 Tax=Roseiconus lacunae TaxID=2605694 RepID=UPI0013DD6838